jgi:diguanylate cyclase (GGDEF)-like protein
MSSITKLKTAQSVRNFEPAVALNLVQAFHRHLELAPLLELFFSQAEAVAQAVGVHYRNPAADIDLFIAEHGRHTASYNLTYQDENLGELTCHFRNRVTEEGLETAEDLITLVMSPVKNALRYLQATRSAAVPQQIGEQASLTPGNDDSLLLLQLDGFREIRTRDGDAWAATLLQSVQSQITSGLRDADAVFRIDEETLAVVLPQTGTQRAEDVAAKLRVLVSSLHLRDGSVTQQLTACMGISGTRNATNARTVLEDARTALHEAQAQGPNTVVSHQPGESD